MRKITAVIAAVVLFVAGFWAEGRSVSAATPERNAELTTLKYGVVRNADSHTPIGHVDSVAGGVGTITVRGWAFDWDDVNQPLTIHVYVGGPAYPGTKTPAYPITANVSRPDVNNVYKGCGNNHGFEATIPVDPRGKQTVYIYAINVGTGSDNPEIGHQTVTISGGTESKSVCLLWGKTASYTAGSSVSKWESSNVGVAKVNEDGSKKCRITARGTGVATIKGYDSNNQLVISLEVKVDDPEITNQKKIKRNSSQRLTISGLNYAQITGYETSKPNVLSVDYNGVLTPHKSGKAVITVHTTGGSFSKKFKVKQ
ncbi:MAG: hypothetical protein IJT34_05790 [Butyrivibrio sp.]|nr:hypothetical protein [Butyrivibrio sp.]